MAMKADKIIYGNIYTVDKKQPRARAAAIADGKFVYVGDEEGVKDYIGEETKVQRYEDGIILQGLEKDMDMSLQEARKRFFR